MSRSLCLLTGLAAGLLWAGSAFAEPSPADRATARSLAGEGYQALQDKDYATAADRFSRADALVHAPTLMIDWARALVGLGKLVEAQERCEQIVREGVDAKAPRSWQRALADANSELAELKPRLGWLTISVSGGDKPNVTIDDVPVPTAAIGIRRAVNPGSLTVQVQAPGFVSQTKKLELAEGATSAVDFNLSPVPEAKAEYQAPPPPPAPTPPRTPTLMYVAFAASGTGLVVGGVTGALALHKHSELKKVCIDGGCPETSSGDISSYHTLGTVSAVGFAVGVAGAGAGLALWLLNRPSASSPAAQGTVVYPYLGPTSIGAVGRF
jgi:hypothetical protein